MDENAATASSEHFVTLLDAQFLPQGLALKESLSRHIPHHVLWVLCLDDESADFLESRGDPRLRTLPLAPWITDSLRQARETRTAREFAWTLTPFAPQFVFESTTPTDVRRVTYLDADLYILKNPQEMFDELEQSGKHVLITEHAFSPEFDVSKENGRYCVQFITFRREGSRRVLKWWQDKCLEWCFAFPDNGRFGDQKYLDDWPTIFGGDIHVLEKVNLALGPWNALRFPYSDGAFYHMQGVRLLKRRRVHLGDYPLPQPLIDNVYQDYLVDFSTALEELTEWGIQPQPQAPDPALSAPLRAKLRWVRRSWRRHRSNTVLRLPVGHRG